MQASRKNLVILAYTKTLASTTTMQHQWPRQEQKLSQMTNTDQDSHRNLKSPSAGTSAQLFTTAYVIALLLKNQEQKG